MSMKIAIINVCIGSIKKFHYEKKYSPCYFFLSKKSWYIWNIAD
jgi:hypothetical protein